MGYLNFNYHKAPLRGYCFLYELPQAEAWGLARLSALRADLYTLGFDSESHSENAPDLSCFGRTAFAKKAFSLVPLGDRDFHTLLYSALPPPSMVWIFPFSSNESSQTLRLRSHDLPPEGTLSWWKRYHLPSYSMMLW